jgi:hypothetical protein
MLNFTPGVYYAYANYNQNMQTNRYYDDLYEACEWALTKFLGTDVDDEGMFEAVVGRVDEALKGYREGSSYSLLWDRIEGSSTYVASDLSEEELSGYTELFLDILSEYQLL